MSLLYQFCSWDWTQEGNTTILKILSILIPCCRLGFSIWMEPSWPSFSWPLTRYLKLANSSAVQDMGSQLAYHMKNIVIIITKCYPFHSIEEVDWRPFAKCRIWPICAIHFLMQEMNNWGFSYLPIFSSTYYVWLFLKFSCFCQTSYRSSMAKENFFRWNLGE